MSNWEAVGALGFISAVVLSPGVVVALSLGARSFGSLLIAAPLGSAVITAAALFAPSWGLGWGLRPVLALTAFVVAACVLGRLVVALLREGRAPSPPPDQADVGAVARHARCLDAYGWTTVARSSWGRRAALRRRDGSAGSVGRATVLAVLLGWSAACVLGFLTFTEATGRWDAVSQTYDAVFHLNAVRWVDDTGSASPLDVGRLNDPHGTSFYPAGWHALTSLALPVVEGSTPAAANLASLAVALVVWPLGCLFLARQLVGPRPALLAASLVLSMGFAAFPWFLLSWGVLWPQMMGTALLPALLAGATSVLGIARQDVLAGRGQGLVVTAAAALACLLAHPGALLSGVLLTGMAVMSAGVERGWRRWSQGAYLSGVAPVAVAALLVFGGWVLLDSVPGVFRAGSDWPATTTVSREVERYLVGAPDSVEPAPWVNALVLVGLLVCLRHRRTWWLVAAYVLTVYLDVMAAAVDSPLSNALTGYWYNDRYRLAAVVPVVGVGLAVLGLGAVATTTNRLVRHLLRLAGRAGDRVPGATVEVVAAVLLVALAVPSGWYGLRGHQHIVALRYVYAEEHPRWSLVTAAEQRFLEGIGRHVPAGERVLGAPWDGSSLAYALGGREVVFPHLRGRWSEDELYVSQHLVNAAADPEVCPRLRRMDVRWVLDGGDYFRPPLTFPVRMDGLRGLPDAPGFELVASGGDARLIRVTACDPGWSQW